MSDRVVGSLDYRLFAKRLAILASDAASASSRSLNGDICLTEKISLADVKEVTGSLRSMLDMIERDASEAEQDWLGAPDTVDAEPAEPAEPAELDKRDAHMEQLERDILIKASVLLQHVVPSIGYGGYVGVRKSDFEVLAALLEAKLEADSEAV